MRRYEAQDPEARAKQTRLIHLVIQAYAFAGMCMRTLEACPSPVKGSQGRDRASPEPTRPLFALFL